MNYNRIDNEEYEYPQYSKEEISPQSYNRIDNEEQKYSQYSKEEEIPPQSTPKLPQEDENIEEEEELTLKKQYWK